MKNFIFIILFTLLILPFTNCCLKGESFVKKGIYACCLYGHIVFFSDNNSKGESSNYDLKIINLSSKIQTVIAKNLPIAQCEKWNSNEIIYSNGKEIISFNLKEKKSKSIFHANIDSRIVGFKCKIQNDGLFIIQIDYKRLIVMAKLVSTRTNLVLFEKSLSLNQNELESISTICYWLKRDIVFSFQDKLYSFEFAESTEFSKICDKLDGFGIDNSNVIFYQFISDEKTEARYLDLKTKIISNKIDQSLNQKIYNCTTSEIITTIQEGAYKSYYLVCSIPYVFSNSKWEKTAEVILYMDNQIEIKFARNDGLIDKKTFICSTK